MCSAGSLGCTAQHSFSLTSAAAPKVQKTGFTVFRIRFVHHFIYISSAGLHYVVTVWVRSVFVCFHIFFWFKIQIVIYSLNVHIRVYLLFELRFNLCGLIQNSKY